MVNLSSTLPLTDGKRKEILGKLIVGAKFCVTYLLTQRMGLDNLNIKSTAVA